MDLESPPVRAPSPEELERARGVRLFFAHQSVGQNILSGVAQLSAHRIEPTPLLALAPNQALPGWVDMPVGQMVTPMARSRLSLPPSSTIRRFAPIWPC